MSKDRKFGVEIEAFNVPMGEVARAVMAAGVECHVEGYNHTTRPHWKVVTDRSLDGLRGAFELVSPVLEGAEGIRQVVVVCEVLNRLGAKVNKSCGLHVHVDARDLEVGPLKSLVQQFIKYESCFDKMVPASRRNNVFCKSLRGRFASLDAALGTVGAAQSITSLRGLFDCDRYHKLNLESLVRHGTVEFRQHAGTTDAEKITAWIGLVVGMVNRCAKAPVVKAHGAGVLRDLLKAAPADKRDFLTKRVAYFSQTTAVEAN